MGCACVKSALLCRRFPARFFSTGFRRWIAPVARCVLFGVFLVGPPVLSFNVLPASSGPVDLSYVVPFIFSGSSRPGLGRLQFWFLLDVACVCMCRVLYLRSVPHSAPFDFWSLHEFVCILDVA